MSKRIWTDFLGPDDQAVYEAAGYGKRVGFGTRPALFIIDMQYNFCGEEPVDIFQGIKKYRTYCGPRGWEAVHQLVPLLHACRERGVPIFYTESSRRNDLQDSGIQLGKSHRSMEKTVVEGDSTRTVAELAPRHQDFRIQKQKPSAFFGTTFMSQLNHLDIDTLIIAGGATSGCVRATAVDAYSYNFRVIVPEETCFDRFEASHAMSLFDLNAKYADVLPVAEAIEYIRNLG